MNGIILQDKCGSNEGLSLVMFVRGVTWGQEDVCGGREGDPRSVHGRRGAGGGGVRGGELPVTIVFNLPLNQIVSCPHELRVPCEVVSVCSCHRLRISVRETCGVINSSITQ